IHPYARIAWSVIGVGYSNQQARDAKIDDLITSMHSALDVVVTGSELRDVTSTQKRALAALVKQTTECGYFVIDYVRKGFCKQVQSLEPLPAHDVIGSRALRGIVSTTDKAIADYRSKFAELRAAYLGQSTLSTQVLIQLVLEKVETFESTITLSDMPFSKDARWRSGKQCLPGTRTELISQILDWVSSPLESKPRMLLLTGLPGSGKSSVAHTVARRLHDLSRLAASYIFDRNDQANRRPAMLFPTLAREMADFNPMFKRALARSANSASLRSTTDLQDQFECFIEQPFTELAESLMGPIVIVIDALDESASHFERRQLLRILLEFSAKLPANVHCILTARPENDIVDTLSDDIRVLRMSTSDDESSLLLDMTAYVSSLLVKPNSERLDYFTDDDCRAIAMRAEGLFQWAFVVCSTITSSHFQPTRKEMLENYKKLKSMTTGGNALDTLYKQILGDLFVHDDNKCTIFRRVLGHVLAAFEPLSFRSISEILQLSDDDQDECFSVLSCLGTLLTGVRDQHEPIRLLHSSFRDFLLAEDRSGGQFHVDPFSHHAMYAAGCLDMLNMKLCFNICGLESSYDLNKDVPDLQDRIQACVSKPLSYAACFWGDYLEVRLLSEQQDIANRLTMLLHTKFLFWLELLSILGAVKTAIFAL
ncbi:hypothetical protein PENSPDRAFT_545232, partial [Peniophora sp. CONT]